MAFEFRSTDGLDSLHDRLGQFQDALSDLHQKMARIEGRHPGPDNTASADLSNSVSSTSSLPTSSNLPLVVVDPEADEQLSAEIADRLREIRDEYEVVIEDALDMGWKVPRAKKNTDGDAGEGDNTTTITKTPTISTRETENEGGFGNRRRRQTVSGEQSDTDLNDANKPPSPEQARLTQTLERVDSAIERAHKAFRDANMNARRRQAAAVRAEHYQVLASYIYESDADSDLEHADEHDDDNASGPRRHAAGGLRVHSRGPRTPSPQTATTSAAADLTAALRQTHARIVGEVARSDFAAQTLEESSRALAELGDRYSKSSTGAGDIGAGLQAARSMVKGLLAAHKSDTWYLQMALYLLAGTAAWLLFRRLLYGPLWLLVWWPLRAVFGTALWMGKASGVGSGKDSVSVSSVIADHSHVTSMLSSVVSTGTVEADMHATETAAAPSSHGSSLVEQIGRVVDGTDSGTPPADATPAAEGADAPNPRKRMWEEPVEAAKYEEQRVREKEAEERQAEGKGKGKEPEAKKDTTEDQRKKDEL